MVHVSIKFVLVIFREKVSSVSSWMVHVSIKFVLVIFREQVSLVVEKNS